MTKERTPRQEALITFIYLYMIQHAGRPPTLNEILDAKVGWATPMGAITSKSVLRYNIQRLADLGIIEHIDDGTCRNISIPGAVFGVPWNVLNEMPWKNYQIFLLDIDDFFEGVLPVQVVDWLRGIYRDPTRAVATVSVVNHEECLAWDDIYPEDANDQALGQMRGHMCERRAFQIILNFINEGVHPDEIAVISNQHEMRLAAVGLGCGLYGHREVHGVYTSRIGEI